MTFELLNDCLIFSAQRFIASLAICWYNIGKKYYLLNRMLALITDKQSETAHLVENVIEMPDFKAEIERLRAKKAEVDELYRDEITSQKKAHNTWF